MVQEFQVVRCFSCHTFQVQQHLAAAHNDSWDMRVHEGEKRSSFRNWQVKKVNRWSCKLCGDKQSLLKEYGRGSGADCRRHVQKLNAMRGAKMEEQEQHTLSLWQQVEEDGDKTPEEERDDQVTHSQVSCWTKYLDTPEEAEPEEDEPQNAFMDGQQLHGNNMMDRKKTRRDRWTDRRQESRTPEQRPVRPSDWTSAPSLSRTSAPSLSRTSAPSLNLTSAPSLSRTSAPSLSRTSAPSLNHTSAPSLSRTSAPSLNLTSAPSLSRTSAPSLYLTSAPSLSRTSAPSLYLTSAPSLSRTSAPSLNHTSAPSLSRTSAPSLYLTSAPSLSRTSAPSLNLTSAPSLSRTSAPSLNHTSAPSLSRTSAPSLNHTSGPSLSAPRKRPRSPPVSSGAGSRWARYLSSGCQVKEGEELSGSGRSLSVAGPSSLSRPRPLLPVSSMFQSGDDFNFDDFLTADST